MIFERTRDYKLVKEIVTHPRIFKWMFGDGGPSANKYEPPELESISYILVRDGEELLGLFIIVPLTNVCVEIHTCFLPSGRKRAAIAYREGIAWLWANTELEKIVGMIPAYNRAALQIALSSGAEVMGVNRRAQRKFGRLQDIVMVGIGRN